ncbi:hypothetical protein RYX36_003826, partial [Vicia faba]
FKDFNCHVEYYKPEFLIVQGRTPPKAPHRVKFTLRMYQMVWTSHHWRNIDVLVLNVGHWWNYHKTIKMNCYFQIGNEVNMNMSTEDTFRISVETIVDWIAREVNRNRTHVFFRTYALVHFRGGDWNTGGGCLSETLPDLGSLPTQSDLHFSIVANVLPQHTNIRSVYFGLA